MREKITTDGKIKPDQTDNEKKLEKQKKKKNDGKAVKI